MILGLTHAAPLSPALPLAGADKGFNWGYVVGDGNTERNARMDIIDNGSNRYVIYRTVGGESERFFINTKEPLSIGAVHTVTSAAGSTVSFKVLRALPSGTAAQLKAAAKAAASTATPSS